MRKDIIIAIGYAKYVAFILATICVLVFQFTASSIWITLALSLYVVAFGLMFVSYVTQSIELIKTEKLLKENRVKVINSEVGAESVATVEGDNNQSEVEVVKLKSEKVWSIIGAIFFGIFTIFTFVVLVLY